MRMHPVERYVPMYTKHGENVHFSCLQVPETAFLGGAQIVDKPTCLVYIPYPPSPISLLIFVTGQNAIEIITKIWYQ